MPSPPPLSPQPSPPDLDDVTAALRALLETSEARRLGDLASACASRVNHLTELTDAEAPSLGAFLRLAEDLDALAAPLSDQIRALRSRALDRWRLRRLLRDDAFILSALAEPEMRARVWAQFMGSDKAPPRAPQGKAAALLPAPRR